jgi:hypothetical protein
MAKCPLANKPGRRCRLQPFEVDAIILFADRVRAARGERPQAVQDLIDKWREKAEYAREVSAKLMDFEAGDWHGEGTGFAECADELAAAFPVAQKARPTIVCLCGSTRFMDYFFEVGWQETLAGKIVLSVGVCKHTDDEGGHGAEMLGPDVVAALDELHLRKIDLADEVFILNVDGYIGESTRNELNYARSQGKRVRFLEPESEVPDAPTT